MSHRKKISKIFSATIASQLCSFIFLPMISRVYSPDEFSHWAIFLVIVATIGAISTFKYADAIVIEQDLNEGKNLFYGSLIAIFISALIGSLISLYFFSMMISCFVFLAIAGIGMQGLSQQVFLRHSHFGRFVTITFLNSLFIPSFQLFFGKAFSPTGEFLIGGATLGFLSAGLTGMFFIKSGNYYSKDSIDKNFYKTLLRYKKFPLYSMSYTLLSAIRLRMIYFFMHNLNPVLNSYYAQSEKLLYAPGNFMGSAVRPVFFNLISRKKINQIEDQLISLLNAIAKITLPCIVISYVFSNEIVRLFFGPKWVSMVFIFRMLHFPAFFLLLTNWLDRAFDVLDAQFELFRLEFIFVLISLLIIAFNFIFLHKDENLLIISLTLSAVIYYCIWIWRLFVRANFSSKKYLTMISIWILFVTLWYLFIVFLKNSITNYFINIPITGIVFLIYCSLDKDIRTNALKVLK